MTDRQTHDDSKYRASTASRGKMLTSPINHMLPKLDSLGYIFVADSMDLASVNLTQLAPKAVLLCEITRNDVHRAVQGHSRSPI